MIDSLDTNTISNNEASAPKRIFRFWRCFWLSVLAVSLGYAWYCFYAPPNSIAWAENYTSAQQQALDSGKPMVLFFSGEWCSPCRIMKRQVWADEDVKQLVNDEFIPVEIDVDNPEEAEVMARYRVGGAPVTIVASPTGNSLGWRVGRIRKTEFIALLRNPNPPTTN